MNKLIILLGALFLVTTFGCEDNFEDLEKDPNRPVTAPASLILNNIEFQMYNSTGRAFSGEMRWNQFYCSNYNYYATNEYTWSEMPNHFITLKMW